MPECETLVVFRILWVLARARDIGNSLPVDAIALAAHIRTANAERYLNVLKHAGAVRAEIAAAHQPEYTLTRYGLGRLAGGAR